MSNRASVFASTTVLVLATVLGLATVGVLALAALKVQPKPAPASPLPVVSATPPASWASHNEEEWLVGEVARDVLEMVAYAKSPTLIGKSGPSVGVASLPGAAASYEVTASTGPEDPPLRHRIVLYDHVWAPPNYESLARAAIERLKLKAPEASAARGGSLLSVLLDLKPGVLERENERVSARLAADMLSAAAHEEAAFLLGAFALRENAGPFSDTRPALCRMTAHLAMAQALRGAATPGSTADYDQVLLTTLIGRQAEAVDGIERLRRGKTTSTDRAWLAALGMRNTGDWRLLADPARASLLEKIEYVMAVKRSQDGLKALEFLSKDRQDPTTEWARIALSGGMTVEEGNAFGPQAVALEMQEWASVSALLTGKTLGPEEAASSLNLRTGRCVWHPEGGELGPRVIDRGLWAAFAQRHVLSALQATEIFLERALGLREEAADYRLQMTKEFAALALFPPLRESWQGRRPIPKPDGLPPKRDPDEGRCLPALELIRHRPQLVTASSWWGLGARCWQARKEKTLVDPKVWFATGLPMGTLYDFDGRSYVPALGISVPEIERLAKLAPYDGTIMYWRSSRRPVESKLTPAEFDTIYGPVVAYDSKAQRIRATRVEATDAESRLAAKTLCETDADQCISAANRLVDQGATEEAVAAYERAVKLARDRVGVSQYTRWLVQHYFEEGRDDRALEVARMSAAVYSGGGLDTLAQLLERMGRYEEAESTYRALAERYPQDEASLLAFYVRYERRVADGKFRAQAAAAEKKLFPNGMTRTSLADLRGPSGPFGPAGHARPGSGFLDEPPKDLKALGLRVGDNVMAIDGYRVSNDDQYTCIIRLTDQPEVTMIVSRNGEYVELAGKMDRRRFGPRQPKPAASPPR
jgi:tetratricopeptide (TPR) repeat protein